MSYKEETILNGNCCPECGTGNVESSGQLQVEGARCWLTMFCCKCDAEWIEYYQMSEVVIVTKDKK